MLYLFGNLSWPQTWIQTQIQKFCNFFCNPFLQTNLIITSRRPTPQVLYLFGNLSWPPTWIQTQMQKFCKFFCNSLLQTNLIITSRRPTPQVLYLFGNLSWPPTWIQSQMQKFCNFCNQFLQTQNMETSRGPTLKCYTFSETSHDPKLKSQLRCKIMQFFLQPHYTNTPNVIPFWNIDLTLYLKSSSLYPFTLPLPLKPLHLNPIPFTPTHLLRLRLYRHQSSLGLYFTLLFIFLSQPQHFLMMAIVVWKETTKEHFRDQLDWCL